MEAKEKRRRRRNKPHIRQKEFRSRNISSIEHHVRKGKTLVAPFMSIPGPLAPQSWKDQCIPNILWACVLSEHLPRERYLALFRSVVINTREHLEFEKTHITHNYLAKRNEREFRVMFQDVLADSRACKSLAALRVVECLPDRHLWAKCFPEPDPQTAWSILAHAVASNIDHQSEKATDVRWLKLMYLAVTGRIYFPQGMNTEELRLYPSKGDMRSVRPNIRAMELAFRGVESGSEKPVDVPEAPSGAFWIECYKKTGCIVDRKFDAPRLDTKSLFDELWKISEKIAHHFRRASDDTGIDPRLDATFGLVLYALALTIDVTRSSHHLLAGSRIILRSIVELSITLSYLAKKDNADVWRQFRNYGAGQAKLSFLKILREQKIPDFIDPHALEMLANEDVWQEFQNVSLGAWANSDLRKMSEEAGCKDIYDKFYGWSSAFAHGNWGAVRDTVFATCMNPLHRLHRVPAPTRVMPSILKDCCVILNRMLRDLDRLYPSFKRRVKWHKTVAASAPTTSAQSGAVDDPAGGD